MALYLLFLLQRPVLRRRLAGLIVMAPCRVAECCVLRDKVSITRLLAKVRTIGRRATTA